jgi:UDP-N-acetylglucosamine 4,6-dehydratase/5-epimerase
MTGALDWSEAAVLVKGGTGSFGNRFVDIMLERYRPRRLVVFSRDELKHSQIMARLKHPSLALKQIPSCEYNPFEAIQTNVICARSRRTLPRASFRCRSSSV